MQSENLETLRACSWKEASSGVESTLTPHDFTRAGYLDDAYDAFKMTGNYDASSQTESAYAGMVAYRFKLPAAYRSGSANLVSITLPVSRDRFLRLGVHLAAAVSSSASPSTSWDVVRGNGSDHALASQLSQSAVANIKASTAADSDVVLSLTGIDATKHQYLWIYLTLEDYTDHWTMYSSTEARLYAIEGSAALVGSAAVVSFSADVAADSAGTVFTAADKASMPYLVGGDDLVTGILTVQRMANGSPFVEKDIRVSPSTASQDVAGLSACYAALLRGGGDRVSASLGAPDRARPGAGFSVRYVTSGESAGWRITASAIIVPCVMPSDFTPSGMRLEWDSTHQQGGRVNVWMKRGDYVFAYPDEELDARAIWDASSAKSGHWELLGTVDSVSSAGSAEIELPQMSCAFASFLFTAYIPIDAVNLSGTWPQGVGNIDVDVLQASSTGLKTGFIPTIKLIG